MPRAPCDKIAPLRSLHFPVSVYQPTSSHRRLISLKCSETLVKFAPVKNAWLPNYGRVGVESLHCRTPSHHNSVLLDWKEGITVDGTRAMINYRDPSVEKILHGSEYGKGRKSQ